MTNGVYYYFKAGADQKNVIHYNENHIERLFKESFCDIQIYHMKKGKLLFIEPARNPKAYKSYYFLTGQAKELASQQIFTSGDAILGYQMTAMISLLMETDTDILVHSVGISVEEELQINKDKLNDLMEDLYVKDPYEKGHAIRVFEMVKILGIQKGFSGEQLYALNKAARFFDIGKIHIDENLLKKQGPLTFDEVEIIRFHVTMSDKLVRYYYGLNTSPGILEHHEWWDGSGYPGGISGEAISLEARLISICDSFDAMTHQRPYREAMDPEAAIAVLEQEAGSHYDPELVSLFVETYRSGAFDFLIGD